eukprot:2071720-Amphidinium_carterae.1
MLGWRGQPGKKDEPQHMVQGASGLERLGHPQSPDPLQQHSGSSCKSSCGEFKIPLGLQWWPGARMRAMLDAMKIPYMVLPDYLDGNSSNETETAPR